MTLAFVGAVEQNLLGFPAWEAGDRPLLYPRIATHLQRCLEGEVSMPEQAGSNQLLEEGAASYLTTLRALSSFCSQVQSICSSAIERHLKDLGAALGLTLKPQQVKPDKGSDELTWARVGAKISHPAAGVSALWCYVFWDDEGLSANVSITLADLAKASRAWAAAPGIRGFDFDKDGAELSAFRTLGAAGLSQLGGVLDELIPAWTSGWRKLGGTKAFLAKR
jgi:hypothetical protein